MSSADGYAHSPGAASAEEQLLVSPFFLSLARPTVKTEAGPREKASSHALAAAHTRGGGGVANSFLVHPACRTAAILLFPRLPCVDVVLALYYLLLYRFPPFSFLLPD